MSLFYHSHFFLRILFLLWGQAAAFQNNHARSAPPPSALYLFGLQQPRKYDGDASVQAEIRALFFLWNDALATGDSRIVTARYAEDAVLFPIDSDIPRMDLISIKAYYDSFLIKRPQAFQTKSQIKMGKGWAQDS